MKIYDYLRLSEGEKVIREQLDIIQKKRKEKFSEDDIIYILHKFIDPERILIKKFSKVISVDVKNKSMVEIYDTIKTFFSDEVLFITNWDIARNTDEWAKRDEHYNMHIDKKIDRWDFNKNTEEFYVPETYYEIIKENYDKKTFFQIIDEFKSFENYHGYLIDKTKIESFKHYLELKDKKNVNDKSIDDFNKSVKGYFSGIHEHEILFVVLQ
jgi:hypothetical protein